RLGRNERTQAEALERLGAEISRLSERLTDRITLAERRAGQAIDDVGDQVARVTERLSHRTERVSEELADRIRQSEARTARLLEEARERIDQRLAETQRRSEEVAQTALSYNLPEPEAEPAPFPSFAPAAEAVVRRPLAARVEAAATYAPGFDPDR